MGSYRTRPLSAAVTLLLVMGWVAACSLEGAASRPDIVLIVIDTLRRDHMSVYGYSRPTTPNLERIAAKGVTFEVAYAPTGTTAVSHATLFTSRYPLAHGLLQNGQKLPAEELTLAERLWGAGYRTAAFVSSFPVSRRFGFSQGFDHFDDSFDLSTSSSDHRTWLGIDVPEGFDRPPGQTTDATLDWLEASQGAETPLFLWVHYFDPHSPYTPPREYAKRFAPVNKRPNSETIAKYDAEIAYSDAEVGRLFDELSRRRPDRETLVIITADHGEGLWSHGWIYHDRYTYEEEVRIPLIMIWDGHFRAGSRIEQPAHLIDIVPTILSAAGIKAPADDLDGIDLIPYAQGSATPDDQRPMFLQRPFFPEGRAKFHEKGHGFGLRLGRWKFFEAPEEGRLELYDLSSDPSEKRNLSSKVPDTVARLSALIAVWRKEQEAKSSGRELSVPPDALEGLHALGYVDDGEGQGEGARVTR